MKSTVTGRLPAVLLIAGLAAVPTAAQPVFDRYVAIGDSLTAGFMSSSLHIDGQITSFPRLIYTQATGDIEGFEQPLVLDPGFPGVLVLRGLSPLVIAPKEGFGIPINLDLPRPYDNLGVPGADAKDVVETSFGGLADLVLRGAGTQLELALALDPTFVSIWIGNNDVLAAATSGIVIEGVTLTPVDEFESALRTIVGTLAGAGVPGMVLGTIPNVSAITYTTTIPPVVIDPATNEPLLVGGQPVPLIGPQGPLGPGDLVLLSAAPLLAQGIGIPAALGGSGDPLPDDAVLDAAEAATISDRVDVFNDLIRGVAAEAGAAVAETGALQAEIFANGLQLGGIEYSADFLTGGTISLDGVHPTQLGYALAANEFIQAINRTYGAAIPLLGLAPFAFTDLGLAPGLRETPLGAGEVIFTKAAYRQLRTALGVPGAKKLARLKKKLASAASERAAARTIERFNRRHGRGSAPKSPWR